MKLTLQKLIVLISFIFLLTSCASTQKTLTTAQKNNIKKVGLIITQVNEDMKIIDHIQGIPSTYTGYQGGALVALVDLVIIGSQKKTISNKSLGGDPEILKQKLTGFNLTKSMQDSISAKLSKKYDVIPVEKTSKLRDQLDKLDVDSLLEVNYIFGLAVYEEENASPAIVSDLIVTDVKTDSTLMKNRISSDAYYRNNNVVENFARNDAKLFKSSINQSVKVTSIVIGSEFGIDKHEIPQNNFTESIYSAKVTCNKPYKLTQSCSHLNGAKLRVTINDVKSKIAGTDDGKTILLMAGSHISKSVLDGLSLGFARTRTKPSIKSFESIKSFLAKNNIEIIKVTKLVSHGAIDGYLLELSDDGYSILKENSKERVEEVKQEM